MRKYFILILVSACLYGFRRMPDDVSKKVVQAAGVKLPSFLANIPAGSEGQFGMSCRDEIKAATLGNPYRVLALTDDFFNSKDLTAAPYATYITGSNVWRVPVKVNGEPRLLITVNNTGGSYTAGDIGGAGLAQEIQQLGKPQKKHTYGILRVYQVKSDFFVDMPGNSLAGASFIPLSSARMAIPALTANKHSYSLTETLNAIKNKLNK